MAPRRQPLPLYSRCILLLSRYLEFLSNQESATYCSHLHIATQYIKKHLPQSLLSSIGESILELRENGQQPISPTQLILLLDLKSKRLAVSGSVVNAGVLESRDGTHLEKLSLYYGGCGDRALKMQSFLYSAVNLTNIHCTDFCNDNMLKIIASTCSNLHCLTLNACDVTNEGVLKLSGLDMNLRECIDILKNGKSIKATSTCAESLKQIKLTMTKVTEAGVAIILIALPNIELLRVPDIQMIQLFNFLQVLDHKCMQNNLVEFHSREILDEFQLGVLTDLCPNLQYIQVTFIGNTEMDIIRLQTLARLNKLTRAKIADVSSDALIWFLERVGSRLVHLHLHTYHTKNAKQKLNITRRHVQSLARYCPMLKNLTIDGYNLTEEELIEDDPQYFEELTSLVIVSMKLTEEDLYIFLSKSRKIQTLDLTLLNPHVLHDRIIINFLESGTWSNIVKFRILNSPITQKVAERIVRDCPLLHELGCLYSWLISKQQLREFKEQIKLENLNLEVY